MKTTGGRALAGRVPGGFACAAVVLLLGCGGGGGDGTGDPTPAPTPTPTTTPTATPTPSPGGSGRAYYVRPDGGTAAQCTGQTDAPYSGSGTAQACAWNHPFQALPPGGPARLPSGATLLIAAGSYRMGVGAPGADACDATAAWDCHAAPNPSGLSAAEPTRVLGAGWNNGCASPPQLWGTERADRILDLTNAQHVEVACLEITDHSGCVESHSGGLACQRDNRPYGDWAAAGLIATDASDVALRNLDIHGLASTGILAGRLRDWTVENVRVAANGWVGWDGDVDGNDSNSGNLIFRHLTIEWNGCGETYPGKQPTGCWAQTAGGYGDGLGTGSTGGNWLFEDSAFLHNTSDGLDLLYLREAGGSVTIRRTIAEGNAGNQIKTTGNATIENSIAVGNCGFFEGASVTYNVDPCRAAGNAVSLTLLPGNQVKLTNNTITSEGDCLVIADCEGGCQGSERVRLRNNLLVGQPDLIAGDEDTCLFWTEGLRDSSIDMDYSLVYHAKGVPPCPGSHDLCDVAPGVANAGIDSFDAHLAAGSAAIGAASAAEATGTDFDNQPRDSTPDIGAYERR